MSIFFCGTSGLQRKEGEVFILTPQKLDVGNQSIKTGTSSFGTGTSVI
jgi:hypothetical protein